ncbi:MAG: hypothetical protein QXW98_04540 [Candidatus Caldarchaeum sp.]
MVKLYVYLTKDGEMVFSHEKVDNPELRLLGELEERDNPWRRRNR